MTPGIKFVPSMLTLDISPDHNDHDGDFDALLVATYLYNSLSSPQ